MYEIINMAGFRCKLSENPKIRRREQLGLEPLGQYEKKSLKQDYYVTDPKYFGDNKMKRAGRQGREAQGHKRAASCIAP